MTGPPYRSLRIFLRAFSVLAALGGLLMIFAEKPSSCGSFCDHPRGRCPHGSCRFSKRWAAWCSCSACSCGSLHAISTQCGSRGRTHSRALHSGSDTASFALDDGHSQYVSGVPLVGAICRAARNSRFALLAEATGGALGACREFLK